MLAESRISTKTLFCPLVEQLDVMKTLTSRSIIQLRRCSDALHGFRFA
jgi:hypothetical protein